MALSGGSIHDPESGLRRIHLFPRTGVNKDKGKDPKVSLDDQGEAVAVAVAVSGGLGSGVVHALLRTPSWDCPKVSETPVTQLRGPPKPCYLAPFGFRIPSIYAQSVARTLFGHSQKGYKPTEEYIRKDVEKPIAKETS